MRTSSRPVGYDSFKVDAETTVERKVVLSGDDAEIVFAKYRGLALARINAFRKGYVGGVVAIVYRHQTLVDGVDIYYENQSGREYVTLVFDARVVEEALEESGGGRMMLILHNGNRITAVPMSRLDNLSRATASYSATLRSSWGNYLYEVNQLRLGDTYSVVRSGIHFSDDAILVGTGQVFVVSDDVPDYISNAVEVAGDMLMNGSRNMIYAGAGQLRYAPDTNALMLSSTTGESGDAVDASGTWYLPTSDANSTTYYTCSVVRNSAKRASPPTIRVSREEAQSTPVSVPFSSQGWSFNITAGPAIQDGSLLGLCGQAWIITPTPTSSSGTATAMNVVSSFDGISLGQRIFTPEVTSVTSDPRYIITEVKTYRQSQVRWDHWPPPKGDGRSGVETAGGGTIVSQRLSPTPDSGGGAEGGGVGEAFFCDWYIGPFDGATGGAFGSSDDSIDAVVAQVVANLNVEACGGPCLVSYSLSPSQAYVTTGTQVRFTVSGDLSSVRVYPFPYAVEGKLYFQIDQQIYTPHGKTYSGQPATLVGWMNVTNGRHLLQGYTVRTGPDNARETVIVLNGQEVQNQIATLAQSTVDQINAVFFDIPITRIKAFRREPYSSTVG